MIQSIVVLIVLAHDEQIIHGLVNYGPNVMIESSMEGLKYLKITISSDYPKSQV